ncbi:hypothetical protein DY000_02055591 [Brassica cretica]|uniref:Uncharacterized protein n=1 Tax=Brassica cretica TaxID=69181 RepID=A0ABQ7A6L0_BRACR|nr:hypothetical protein DY000_02055591 [Brassica cretica]
MSKEPISRGDCKIKDKLSLKLIVAVVHTLSSSKPYHFWFNIPPQFSVDDAEATSARLNYKGEQCDRPGGP